MQEQPEQRLSKHKKGGPCPHLGLSGDPDIRFSFPVPANSCHKTQPPASVKLDHQEKYCLNEQYVACPIYQQKGEIAFPKGGPWLKERKLTRLVGDRRLVPKLFVLVAAILIIAAVLLLRWSPPAAPGATRASDEGNSSLETVGADRDGLLLVLGGTNTPTATPSVTKTALPASATTRSTAIPSSTMTRTPTVTNTATSPPDTATATESVEVCVIPATWVPYRVGSGDTLFRISLRYNLSLTELQEANCLSTTNIDAGQVIYVPFLLPAATVTLTSPPPIDTPSPTPQPTSPPPPTQEPPPPPPTQEPPPPPPTETQPPPPPSPIPTPTPPMP